MSIHNIKELKNNEYLNRADFYLTKVQQIAKIGFWELDLVTGNNWWSEEVYKIFQLDPALGPPSAEAYLARVHPEDKDKLMLERKRAIQDNTGYVVKIRLIRADGSIAYVINHARVDYDEKSESKKMFGVLQDITIDVERENLNISNNMKISSQNNLTAMGEMVSGIAHEINNPLAIIVGKINFLEKKVKEKYPEDSEFVKDLSVVEKSSLRIAKIISALKTITDSGSHQLHEEVEVDDVIELALSLSYEKISIQSVRFEMQKQFGLKLHGNKSDLVLALLALIYNALDAVMKTENAWIKLDVLLSDEDHILISVTDSGQGIPEEIANKMMNPFFTTKPVGQGMGLGLSLAHNIFKTHSGILKLDQSAAHTRFVVLLPQLGSSMLIPLSIEDAINAHLSWKQKLLSYSIKPDGTLIESEVCHDNLCALGRWIYHPKNKYKNTDCFFLLQTKHALFHKATADLVKKINSGQSVTIELLSDANNSYSSLSIEVVKLLNEMKLKI